MSSNIAPGSKVVIKVVKAPTNQAAAKTITRLLSKDAAARKENDRLGRVRKAHWSQSRRGGRFWDINVVKQIAVKPTVGASGTIVASLDVLTDLKSVSRFVQVAKA